MNNSSQQSESRKLSEPSGSQSLSLKLRRIVKNRYLNMLAGLTLLVVSGDEVWASFANGFQMSNLDSDFGVVVIGLAHMLKTLPDLLEGVDYLEVGDERPKA
jgi:hypothetical protein